MCQNEDISVSSDASLKELAENHGTDKAKHGYIEAYEHYFNNLRDEKIKLLEIGVRAGASLKLWNSFFKCIEIVGIDIDKACKQFENERTKIYIGDQEDSVFLEKVISECGGDFDVIIDDGGHTMSQQITSFQILFSQLKSGGLYVIEDLQTSYWPKFGGGLRKKNTTIEYLKNMVDVIHSNSFKIKHRRRWKKKLTDFDLLAEKIETVHFYNKLCFIIKK